MDEAQKAPKQSKQDNGLVAMLEPFFTTKAPFQLPEGVREWLVKFGPWITLVLLVLALPAVLLLLGISAFVVPAAAVTGNTGFGVGVILLIVQLVLQAASLPGLFARKLSGWNLLFYSDILGLVVSIMNGNIVGAIIGTVIGLYILFQIKSYYK
jgi:hypothetical protein